jgi:hypothetical protein
MLNGQLGQAIAVHNSTSFAEPQQSKHYARIGCCWPRRPMQW